MDLKLKQLMFIGGGRLRLLLYLFIIAIDFFIYLYTLDDGFPNESWPRSLSRSLFFPWNSKEVAAKSI